MVLVLLTDFFDASSPPKTPQKRTLLQIRLRQLEKRGTTPIPEEHFCWDFFELLYKRP